MVNWPLSLYGIYHFPLTPQPRARRGVSQRISVRVWLYLLYIIASNVNAQVSIYPATKAWEIADLSQCVQILKLTTAHAASRINTVFRRRSFLDD